MRCIEAVEEEITYFQKAEPRDQGDFDGMNQIAIEISQYPPNTPRHWRFQFHLPGEMMSRGYRIVFKELDWWDLSIPDYWQDDYGN